jgi:hypothetical protein
MRGTRGLGAMFPGKRDVIGVWNDPLKSPHRHCEISRVERALSPALSRRRERERTARAARSYALR